MDNMNNDSTESSEQSLTPHPPPPKDSFGNSKREPRVGDEYQAQIPPLTIDCCCQNTSLEFTSNPESDFYVGLPVPITWVNHNSLPIPPAKTWDPIERESFVLGLYIFGRNLKHVKKFVKSKKMGDILSYYYGEFYKSSAYNRWSVGKKIKSKGCIRGKKIFAGWRRGELFSRLFLHASEETKSSLKEINLKYEENKVSLEEYVFQLKHIVGIRALIEAIAIGRGKRDLTLRTSDPRSTQNTSPDIPKIPKKKALASLAPKEIIKYLTEAKLSKSQLRDLFWEAVWPRLLANGWHSEQPKGYAILYPRRSILYIKPGIEKFSRRELTKGLDYFDSVTDVLDKVASDPSLLEEKVGEEMVKDKNEMDLEIVEKPDKSPEFTIVDTSLRFGGRRVKVVEKRTLPEKAAADVSFVFHFQNEGIEKSSRDNKSKKKPPVHSPKSLQKDEKNTCYADGKRSGDEKNKSRKKTLVHSPKLKQKDEKNTCSADGKLSGDENMESQELERNAYEEKVHGDELKSQALVELNLPQLAREPGANGNSDENAGADHEDSGIDVSTNIAPSQASEQCSSGLISRRQSKRSRPLTTKALEAIADGLISPARKRKNVEKDK